MMEKQYEPILKKEKIVITKVRKFFEEKSFKKINKLIIGQTDTLALAMKKLENG